MDLFVSITTILSNIAVVIGMIIALVQLKKLIESNKLQRQSIVADHDRRKKQSTIEYFTVINNETHLLLSYIRESYSISPITVDQIQKDAELLKNVQRYLSLMERLAVGVRTNVYDINIINNICGASIMFNYKRFSEFIIWRRKENSSNTTYCEFENLAHEIQILRRNDVLKEIKVKEMD